MHKGNVKFLAGLIIILWPILAMAQSGSKVPATRLHRRVALLDLTARNGETPASTFSLEHALKVAGVSYTVTGDVQAAVQCVMIVTSSYISSTTLKSSEKALLTGYIQNGGVLVASSVKDSSLYSLFGLAGMLQANNRYTMSWNMGSQDPSLCYFDDPNEQTISLGESTYPIVIASKGYSLNGATALALYDDGSAGVTKYRNGAGYAYNIGLSYTDIILRNQLNRDYDAQRTWSNGFEPTSDTIFLFLRAVYQSHVPSATWKHTSPGASKASFLMTHDVDSTTAMQDMNAFAGVEQSHGIIATYNVTAHYFRDVWARDFYIPFIPELQELVARGHKIGSHSVGHFPDFADETVFPEGAPGNTETTYTPYYNGLSTNGGTVYGEVEVSKNLLERDLGAQVRTFRSGYLYFNDKQINVMDALGYGYDSSESANDVLTNFPYRCKYDRTTNGAVSNVYEIPMTISDQNITAENYQEKLAAWLSVIEKNAANSAPTVLLIHPNRDFKLTAEKLLLDQLPADIRIIDMDAFGDYWRNRDNFTFDTLVANNTLTVIIADNILPIDEGLSIIIQGGKSLADVSVIGESGQPLFFKVADWQQSDIVLYQFGRAPTQKDVTPPAISGVADITAEATSGSGARVVFSPTATDNVDVDVPVVCTPASGSTFPLGSTPVSCSTVDTAGNKATAAFTVRVQDTTPPVLTIPAGISVNAAGASGALVTYTASALDIVDGSVSVSCTPASGSTFPVGTTMVNCSATDSHGNTAKGSFPVAVTYKWAGFFQPVDNPQIMNVAKAGSAIPVKFRKIINFCSISK